MLTFYRNKAIPGLFILHLYSIQIRDLCRQTRWPHFNLTFMHRDESCKISSWFCVLYGAAPKVMADYLMQLVPGAGTQAAQIEASRPRNAGSRVWAPILIDVRAGSYHKPELHQLYTEWWRPPHKVIYSRFVGGGQLVAGDPWFATFFSFWLLDCTVSVILTEGWSLYMILSVCRLN